MNALLQLPDEGDAAEWSGERAAEPDRRLRLQHAARAVGPLARDAEVEEQETEAALCAKAI